MNVIFLDFDGVIFTTHRDSMKDVEKRICILSEMCHKYNANIVISSTFKDAVDPDTLEIDKESIVYKVVKLFDKYNIKFVGVTPRVIKRISDSSYIPSWKEDEIISYLESHPEVEHFCVIDDEVHSWQYNGEYDLDKLLDYLVVPIYTSSNHDEEGLLPKHIEEVGNILKKENKFKFNNKSNEKTR